MLGETLEGLSRIVQELARSDDAVGGFQRSMDIAVRTLGGDHGSVRICDGNAELRPLARSGVGAESPAAVFRKGQGVMGWAVKTGKIARVSDSAQDDRFAPLTDDAFAVRSLMSIPLSVGERVLGVFSVSAARPAVFDERHEQAGIVIAHALGQALRNAELEREATTDAMTRAYNRSRLLPCLEAELNRSRRDGKPLSVLLMDLDNFKSVNDRFGHTVGDAVLCSFADIVRSCVRSFDILIRRGGEEFELVMPATGPVEGRTVAERIRTRLSREPLRFSDDVSVAQTVSIGLATWDGREDAGALDHRADLAMYAAKSAGRDRVVASSGSRSSRDRARAGTAVSPPSHLG